MEEKQIEINERKISYTVKNSRRAKGIRLAISCDGGVKVTAPYFLNYNVIEKFIFEKSKWILSKLDYFKKQDYIFIKSGSFLRHKEEAYNLAKERIEYLNSFYGFKYNKISIRNQKSRWGSCSKKNNLNFSYKIAFLPKDIVEYIIVHELCHLKEFNHSKDFWELVSKAIPEYIIKRKQLKRFKFL